jgi:hypothetical protein
MKGEAGRLKIGRKFVIIQLTNRPTLQKNHSVELQPE